MSCSSSSDSEDEKLKLILEAADTNLLRDSLFNPEKEQECLPLVEITKSQRHLEEDDQNCIDFVPTEAVQRLMSKKLALLVCDQIEFVADADANNTEKRPKQKSRVRLLSGFECYVKPYEDYQYEDLGPRKKPTIKRRAIDSDMLDETCKLNSVVVDGDYILAGRDTESWSKKSKGKVFCYKLGGGSSKLHHLIEAENEFTKMRRKNKWNESKIRETKFFVK